MMIGDGKMMGQNHYTIVGDGKLIGQNNRTMSEDGKPIDIITIQW